MDNTLLFAKAKTPNRNQRFGIESLHPNFAKKEPPAGGLFVKAGSG